MLSKLFLQTVLRVNPHWNLPIEGDSGNEISITEL